MLVAVVLGMIVTPELNGMTNMLEKVWKTRNQIPPKDDPPNAQSRIDERRRAIVATTTITSTGTQILFPLFIAGAWTAEIDRHYYYRLLLSTSFVL